jgi:hypothetical protein
VHRPSVSSPLCGGVRTSMAVRAAHSFIAGLTPATSAMPPAETPTTKRLSSQVKSSMMPSRAACWLISSSMYPARGSTASAGGSLVVASTAAGAKVYRCGNSLFDAICLSLVHLR